MSARRFQVRAWAPHPNARPSWLIYDAHDPDGLQLASCFDPVIARAIADALANSLTSLTAIDEHKRREGAF